MPSRSDPWGDYWNGEDIEVRRIQPFQATKTYVCPGCNGDITPGTAHVVAVPPEDPEQRRHWHTACWTNRSKRRPGRR